jgi:hypothetical protein
MNGPNSRHILIVDADRFEVIGLDESESETVLGRELAEFLVKSLRSNGIKADDEFEAEFGYLIDFDIDRQAYRVWVQCEGPLGPPPGKETWAIVVQRRLGCIGGLFALYKLHTDLEPCISVISKIAAKQELGSNSRWITDDELDRLRKGEEVRNLTQ